MFRAYKPIRWREQRRQYKLDFETEYPVYLRLKEDVDAVRIKFKQLQEEYHNAKQGTPEHSVSPQSCNSAILLLFHKSLSNTR